MKRQILIIASSLTSFFINGQSLEQLVELHKHNLSGLYMSRGLPEDWVMTGDVTIEDITYLLDNYSRRVGVLIYTHSNDTLIVTLVDREGKINTAKLAIARDSLVSHIERANLWFSRHSMIRLPSKRGASLSLDENLSELDNSFEFINNLLLPFNDLFLNFDHLIIIPTLSIATLPFAAFKLQKDLFLIDQLSYSIAPSLFELKVSAHKTEDYFGDGEYSFKKALFVANPSYPQDAYWEFPNLPGTEKEVNAIINDHFPTAFDKLEHEMAKVSAVTRDICNYDLLYFATHGVASTTNALDESFLVFAKDLNGNSFLTARMIQELRHTCVLRAKLVVLSACQTGLGMGHDGGIIGLARAFQIAGAKHVMMSLWSIEDTETAKLMHFFFNFLKKGGEMMPHEALRVAMIKYRNEINNDPYFWASFSIFGIPEHGF